MSELAKLIELFKGRRLDHNQRYRIRKALAPHPQHWSKSFASHSDDELVERMQTIVVNNIAQRLFK